MIHDYRLNVFYNQSYIVLDEEFIFLLQVRLYVIIRLHYTVRYITFDQPIISTLYKLHFTHPSTYINQKWYQIRLDAVGNKAVLINKMIIRNLLSLI